MIFGAGLVAGLLGSIGHALNSHTLQHSAKIAAWAIPFEALYQDGLRQITANTTGLTGYLLQLGPFGGAYTGGPLLRLWALAYLGNRRPRRRGRLRPQGPLAHHDVFLRLRAKAARCFLPPSAGGRPASWPAA